MATLSAAHASTDAMPDPLEQMRQGTEPRGVLCDGDFVLLMSPDGGPACTSASTAEVLEDRRWVRVLQEHADGVVADNSEHSWVTPAPEVLLAHPNTFIDLSKYPVVGEIVDMTVFTEYGDRPPEFFGYDEYPPVKIDITSTRPDEYRVFDIVANIETGDEDTFAPYDFETTAAVADPEEVYILKAKLEIFQEGVTPVTVRGFSGDILTEYVAASYENSMSYYEYFDTGQTYLDAHFAAGEAAAASLSERGVIRQPDPPEPGPPDTRTAEEMERDWFTSLARDYEGPEYTELDVTRAMLDLSYREDEVRDFLIKYMEYDPELVDQIEMGGILASLYESYDWPEDKIINDLLIRRYGQDDIRAFFVDHLNYAPDQADDLGIKTVLARHMDWAVVETLQQWGYSEDAIREFFIEYIGYTEEEAQAVYIDPQASAQGIEPTQQSTTG